MPGEAVAILHNDECQLGREISCKKTDQGYLSDLLIPDDYLVPSQVFTHLMPF